MAETEGFEPPRACTPNCFQDSSLQPDLGTSPVDRWWILQDLNLRPFRYQRNALTGLSQGSSTNNLVARVGIEPTVSRIWTERFNQLNYLAKMVGKTGFEPVLSRSQTDCFTRLSYFPQNGGLDRNRTDDLLSANQAFSLLNYKPKRFWPWDICPGGAGRIWTDEWRFCRPMP